MYKIKKIQQNYTRRVKCIEMENNTFYIRAGTYRLIHTSTEHNVHFIITNLGIRGVPNLEFFYLGISSK